MGVLQTVDRIEEDFGDILFKERKKKGLTLQQLANMVDVKITPSYINRLEKKEKTNPSFVIVMELSRALELSMNEVLKSFGYECVYLIKRNGEKI